MSAAYTPGPWATKSNDPWQIQSASGTTIGRASAGLLTHPESLCNARLMAAAPELAVTLAAVADYWAGGDAPPELEQRIYAALRAAGVRP